MDDGQGEGGVAGSQSQECVKLEPESSPEQWGWMVDQRRGEGRGKGEERGGGLTQTNPRYLYMNKLIPDSTIQDNAAVTIAENKSP